MKKIYLVILISTLSIGVFAQDATTTDTPVLKSKKGENYLPETDEWGLGISADPFLSYLGNFLNGKGADGSSNASPDFGFANNAANNIAVFGKLIKDPHTAYRVRFNVGLTNTSNKAVTLQNQINFDPNFPAFVDDVQKVKATSIVISPGYEKRRGSTRLQGVYGGELVLGYTSSKINYDYGNPMSADFNAPRTTEFSAGADQNIISGDEDAASIRLVSDKRGANFLVGLRGFIGVEYFFAPKISIGGEFGYMFGFQTTARSVKTAEIWDNAAVSTREIKIDQYRDGGVSSIGVGLDKLNGSINLLFYF
jgi:hypothetical protein